MRFKRPIYRVLFYTAWLLVLGGIITLFISANRKSEQRRCQGLNVIINNGSKQVFIAKASIIRSLEKGANGSVLQKSYADINLKKLERILESNAWIRDAELYFDTKGILNVSVAERQPVARIFTTAGQSFYIDTAGYQMPLLESFSAALPVVTGFTAAKIWRYRDTVLLQGIKNIISIINSSPFWEAQIGQIDITPEGTFELVPTIGSHIIRLGNGEEVNKKLARLFVFYQQVLHKAGLAKYSALDVQFEGQVVAVKKGPQSPIDSIQLQKNIQELMRRKATEQEAPVTWKEDSLPIAITASITPHPDSVKALNNIKKPVPAAPKTAAVKLAAVQPKVVKKETTVQPKPQQKPVVKTAAKPKAVMPPG